MSAEKTAQLFELWASTAEDDLQVKTAKLLRKLVRAANDAEALTKLAQLDVLDLAVDPWMKRNWALDLRVLTLLPQVRGLKLNGSKCVTLEPLQGLATLTALHLDELELEDLGWVANLPKLEIISARRNKLRNVDVLASLVYLREIHLAENSLTTLKPFSGLEKLRVLDVSQNMIAELLPISKRRSIRVLRLRRNALNSLEGLEDLRDLDELDVRDNRIMSLKPIKELGLLSTLGIAGNPLTDDDLETIRRSIKLLT
ncbi:MAG: hypothetical protein RI932_2014 [Pseudomonadota bacterium]|jgi:internalin A